MNTALIAIDLQNDYCSPSGYMAERGHDVDWMQSVVHRVDELLLSIDERPCFFTRMVHDEDVMSSDFERSKYDHPPCLPGTFGAKLCVEPRPEDIIVEKHAYSAFFETDLHEYLQHRNITDVILAGTSTHVCVAATAYDAHQRSYNVHIGRELVGTREAEREHHRSFLQIFKDKLGTVLTTGDVKDRLTSAR